MRSPRYTILLANRRTGTVRRFTVARGPAILVCLTLLAVPMLIGLGGIGARRLSQVEIESLRSANQDLRVENESYHAATGELATQISALQAAMSELNRIAEVDPATKAAIDKLPAIARAQAMGGGGSVDPALVAAVNPATGSANRTFGVLRDLLGVLGTRLDSVRSRVESRQALAAATPSIWPLVTGWLTSGFGNRKDPFTGGPEFHPGLDISADKGTPVHATADGTVESVGYNGNYGNAILLSHGFGISTRFGHLSGYAVRQGQKVKRGDVIGFVGSTGRATSAHLHYEILLNGQPINPLRILGRP